MAGNEFDVSANKTFCYPKGMSSSSVTLIFPVCSVLDPSCGGGDLQLLPGSSGL